MLKVFVLGAIAGGAAVWLWRENIESFIEQQTRGIREKAADSIESVEKTAESVAETLRASQEAIRPSPGRSAA
jgi:hypothetical protein